MNSIEERTLALAGLLQACAQVQTLARTGLADSSEIEPVLKSILILDATSTAAVYGGIQGVSGGLNLIATGLLASPEGDKVEVLRYAMSLLHLQNQLYRDQERFTEFGTAIERLSAVSSDQLVDSYSDVYQEFISNMRPQIIVQGEQDYLQQADVPPRIRALLLAGIRSAVLWQQTGGGRFKLIWERTRMQNAAKTLLKNGFVH